MTCSHLAPTALAAHHLLGSFECRSVEQTQWLQCHARQSAATGTTKVLVVTESEAPKSSPTTPGAWQTSRPVTPRTASERELPDISPARRAPRPLGVSLEHEGRGLGAGLLQDIIARTAALGEEIGCRDLLVHAETEDTRDLYLHPHLIPELEPSPTDDLHLGLLMKDIHHTLGST